MKCIIDNKLGYFHNQDITLRVGSVTTASHFKIYLPAGVRYLFLTLLIEFIEIQTDDTI